TATHARGIGWTWIAMPILALPALPSLGIAGIFFLWLGRRAGRRPPERSFIGARPPRRRRYRRGLSWSALCINDHSRRSAGCGLMFATMSMNRMQKLLGWGRATSAARAQAKIHESIHEFLRKCL